MKTISQREINTLCENELSCIDLLHNSHKWRRFRYTSACVTETDSHFILLAGCQVIAIISKADNILFDVAEKTFYRSRKIDKQIDKFEQDFGMFDGGCQTKYIWVAV